MDIKSRYSPDVDYLKIYFDKIRPGLISESDIIADPPNLIIFDYDKQGHIVAIELGDITSWFCPDLVSQTRYIPFHFHQPIKNPTEHVSFADSKEKKVEQSELCTDFMANLDKDGLIIALEIRHAKSKFRKLLSSL
ncbi:hypothetical protein DFS34DRAFT_588714 [Phlyctochytrium arcticum]|nr:hypothetical protein DFS34DRAFT_588714 [Phlyctochytrium arcticum]